MGKSMYNFGNQGKEKARQQRQIDKASKRILAKRQKADIKMPIPPTSGPDVARPAEEDEIVKSNA